MKEKKSYRKLMMKASALVMSAFMLTSAVPVWADDNTGSSSGAAAGSVQTVSAAEDQGEGSIGGKSSEKIYTVSFQTESGKTLASWQAGSDDTWGPAGSISVRSTYYSGGDDYDIVSINGEPVDASDTRLQVGSSEKITGNLTVVYKKHTDSASSTSGTESITYYCFNEEDGSQLFSFTNDSQSIPETLKIGNKTYARDSGRQNDSTDTSQYNLYYKLKEDTNTSYTVNVQYVDEDGSIISARSFYVNGKDHRYVAPNEFSVTSDGTTSYYKATGETTINHKVGDTARTYTIAYRKLSDKDSYDWYVLLYSSQTNACIDMKTVKVSPDSEAKFTPDKSVSINGKNYTINSAFDKEITHAYSDSNHTSYIYYDPEGYSNSSEVQKKTINIRYVNIADGNVLQSHTQEVTSEGDTTLTFPDSFDQDDIHYLMVQGQSAAVDYNFYSPKITYTVYYYDENNTKFRTATITRERVEVITLSDGTTVYNVIPGITRTVVTYTDNGTRSVAATEDATGEQIAEAVAAGGNANGNSAANGNAAGSANGNENSAADNTGGSNGTGTTENSSSGSEENGNTHDTTIDGVQADEIQTPESNIQLDSKPDKNSIVKRIVLIAVGLAAAAVCIFAVMILIRRRKSGNR